MLTPITADPDTDPSLTRQGSQDKEPWVLRAEPLLGTHSKRHVSSPVASKHEPPHVAR